MTDSRTTLIIFCKAPIKGSVKTRLAATVGEEGAANLHRELALFTLQKLHQLTGLDIQLWCSPDKSHTFFQECGRHFEVSLHNQGEGDLGQRMYAAFDSALATSSRAIIIGTDCPALDAEYIRQADRLLKNPHDAVIGPAEDGGYVLLGLRTVNPAYFQAIEWGSEFVLQESLKKLPSDTQCLQTLWDVDRPEDIVRLKKLRAAMILPEKLTTLLDTLAIECH